MQSRRSMMAGSLALAGTAACTTMTQAPASAGLIYAPAPPATPLHGLNMQLLEVLHRSGMVGWSMEPVALPESVNRSTVLPAQERRTTLPIVTTADFALARKGAGPDWHGYDRASTDLLFVSKLYDVGFGFQVTDPAIAGPADLAGKSIAVPARPSAVRMMSEALVEHGWAVDGVEFVDCSPPQGAQLLAEGKVAALAWNLVLPRDGVPAPMLPSPPGARFLSIEPSAIARMNAAVGFELGPFVMTDGTPIISFAQALAAWADTPEADVLAMLAAIADKGGEFDGLPDDVAGMFDWPGLTNEVIHPVAARFRSGKA